MKTLRLMTAALAVGALAASAPVWAQDATSTTTTPAGQDGQTSGNQGGQGNMSGGMMRQGGHGGGGMMSGSMSGMSGADQYKMRWVFTNLDAREVRRYRAAGFDEATIRGAANIALRTGLELGYVLRRIQDTGYSLTQTAVMYGVPTRAVDEDIPGFGAEGMMGMGAGDSMTSGNTSGRMMRRRTMQPQDGGSMNQTDQNNTTTSPSNTTPSSPATPATPDAPPATPESSDTPAAPNSNP